MLPAVLREPLDQIVRRRLKVTLGIAALSTISLALLILLASAAFIGFLLPPYWLRLPIAILFWIGVIYMAGRSARPLLERWTLARTARHVERLFPELQERLSSAVELTCDEPNAVFRGSPDLLDHLVQQASTHAGMIQPAVVIPAKPIWRRAWLLCFAIFTWIMLATNSYTAAPMLRGVRDVSSVGDSLPREHCDARCDARRYHHRARRLTGDLREGSIRQRITPPPICRRAQFERADGRRRRGVFRATLENVQQSFAYRVQSSEGESDWYAVTVHPRPTIAPDIALRFSALHAAWRN